MQIDILTPEKSLFSGEAFGVKLPAISGGLELLENHAPIIVALKKGVVEIALKGETQAIEIEDGFAECFHNKVSILTIGGKLINH